MSEAVKTKYTDCEISKVEDFIHTADSGIAIINAVFDAAFEDVANSFVVSGLTVRQLSTPSMNVEIAPGLAFHRSLDKLLHLGAAISVPVTAAHATLNRLDTLEVRYQETDFDPEARAFKDPQNSTVSYASVNTKTKISLEARCLAGTPGSGAAPAVESGWMKLAEVYVAAGATAIFNASIRNLTAEKDATDNSAWTTNKQVTFALGSIESIKDSILTHAATNISAAVAAHGIRQGTGNGFDADLLDGVHASRIPYGDDSMAVTQVTDANNITKAGFYYLASPYNNGPMAAPFIIIHATIPGATFRAFQIASVTSSVGTLHVRSYISSGWTAWTKLWNASNDGSGSGLDADVLRGTTPGARGLNYLAAADVAALAALLLSDIKTVDGSGSGLDADLLDGIDSTKIPFGGDASAATTITDANSATKSGFYMLASPYNNSPEGGANAALILTIASTIRTIQIGVTTASNKAFIRNWNGTVWSAWAKLWNADNDGPGSGLDADMVDGIEAARIIYGAGTSGTTDLVGDLNNVTKSGFYYATTGSTNKPTTENGYLIHNQYPYDSNYGLQIFVIFHSAIAYIRLKASGTWGTWSKLWTSDNDGSGSGLDADKLDGLSPASAATPSSIMQRDSAGRAKIAAPTASDEIANKAYVDEHRVSFIETRTSDPASPVDGQIWLRTDL